MPANSSDVAAAATDRMATASTGTAPKSSAPSVTKLHTQANGTTNGTGPNPVYSHSGDSAIVLDETDDSQSDQERQRGARSSMEDSSHEIPTSGSTEGFARGPQSPANAKIKTYSDDPDTTKFPRISRPVELLRNEYDVIVIGSGYGGAVAASRMARAGQSVCLLERGKEKWPGEYPSGFVDAMKQLHVSGDFAPGCLKGSLVEAGDPTGLYHLIMGKGQNAFVGNGLGGTSLLNANIFLEADKGTMGMESWPKDLQKPGALKPYYDLAASVLQPKPYPEDWPELPKLTLLEKQQQALGMGRFYRPPQTTRFQGGPNSTGVEMYPSALTAMDSTGVNDGSKSSTLVNYLADAWNWDAEMFCECEVRYIKKNPDPEQGYLVFFAWHGSKRGAFKEYIYEDLMWVRAKKCVFLGAGSIGTTEILLRSKKLGLSMSDKVGLNMSGNGDMLAFGYNTNDEVNAIGRQYPSPYKPIGPTISGIIDCREGHDNPLDGFVIEEGAVPKALAPLFQTMLETMPGKQSPHLGFMSRIHHALASIGSRVLGPYYSKGSIEKTQIYLVMSHDSNQAIMSLHRDQPVLEFMGVGRSEHVTYLNELLKKATEAVGGTFINSPFYAVLGKQEITVHPIGGACMSNDGTGEGGATSQYGEVFSGPGKDTHRGLFVTDGAIIPTALGVNPLATITALAERSVEYAAAKRIHAKINLKQRNAVLNLFRKPGQFDDGFMPMHRVNTIGIEAATEEVESTEAAEASGIGFSEVMTGYIHCGDGIEGDQIEDFETAANTAQGLCEQARFFLSVKAWDTMLSKLCFHYSSHFPLHFTVSPFCNSTPNKLLTFVAVNRSDHSAMLTGTFTCPGVPGSPFMVQRGCFHLFTRDLQASGTHNLTYDFNMTSVNGRQYHFHGYKVIDSSSSLAPFRFWSQTSTLYVTISEDTKDGRVVGRGTMHIKPIDFLSEMRTLKAYGKDLFSRIYSAGTFLTYFIKQSASVLLKPFVAQQYPAMTYIDYINDARPDATYEIVASDHVHTLMYMWESQNPNIETKTIFMVPGASVDQQIFALPTIEVNAVDYFTRAGYRVYVTVHRICNLAVAQNNWTTYDARFDIRACLEMIRKREGDQPIYTICHCMGAVAYSSGLLDGTIPSEWIKGISCSQVFCNPIWATLNLIKACAGPIPFDKLYAMFGGKWFSCSSSPDDTFFQRLVNQALRFYPDKREEVCNNVSCHRSSLVFGR